MMRWTSRAGMPRVWLLNTGLLALLPDAETPTVMQVDGKDTLALQALCHGTMSWQRLEDLKLAGARGLMVLPIERTLA